MATKSKCKRCEAARVKAYRTECRTCKRQKWSREINDTYGTCFDCWEVYKGMSRILSEDKPKRGLEFMTAQDLLDQYDIFDAEEE